MNTTRFLRRIPVWVSALLIVAMIALITFVATASAAASSGPSPALQLPSEVWVGVFLPLVVAAVQQWHWSRPRRTLVGAACCVIAAVILHAGDWNDIHSFLASLTLILTLAATFYRNYWMPSGIAQAIDRATTFTKVKAGDTVHPDAPVPTVGGGVIVSQNVADQLNSGVE